MLSAKQIEEISKQIKQGDAPDAIIALLNAHIDRARQTQEDEKGNNRSLWDLFKDSPKAVVRINALNRVVDVNDAFVTLCKLSKAEVFGRDINTIISAHQESNATEKPFDEAREWIQAEFTIACERYDGKTVVIRIERFPDTAREETYLVITDISEQKRFSEMLAQDSVRGEIFVDIVNALWQDFMNYEKTLDVLTNKVAQHIGSSCVIHLLMDETDIIEHVAINHSDPKAMALFQDLLHSTKWHASAGLPAEVVAAGNALLVPAVTKANLAMLECAPFAECISALQTRSLLMMPMYHSERIIGTITLLRNGSGQPYTNKDKSFVQRIANVGAMAIINAQRMRRFNSELLAKLRSAHAEVRHLRVLEAGFKAFDLLLREHAGPDVLKAVLQMLGSALEAESAFFAAARPSSGMFDIIAAWSTGDFPPALQAKSEGGIHLPRLWTTPLESGAVLHRTAESFTDREKEFLADADLLSIAIVPIIADGCLRGLLAFENCASEEDCLEKNESILRTFILATGAELLSAMANAPGAPGADA